MTIGIIVFSNVILTFTCVQSEGYNLEMVKLYGQNRKLNTMHHIMELISSYIASLTSNAELSHSEKHLELNWECEKRIKEHIFILHEWLNN